MGAAAPEPRHSLREASVSLHRVSWLFPMNIPVGNDAATALLNFLDLDNASP
jgi:hypothetical protein